MYKGPWKIQANKRTPKDPAAPKRPMSAFLAFSNKRRAGLKREHPDATNADLSKMLSKTWKEIPEDIKKKYTDEEAELRATYKEEVAIWRKKIADEKRLERNEREAIAMQTAEARAKDPQGQMMNTSNMNNLVAANNARQNQFNNGPIPNQGSMVGSMGGMPGQMPQQPSQHDMNVGMPVGGYGNPYGMPGNPGSQLGQLGNFGMPGGADAAQYASLMAGGNPFTAQSFMSNTPSSQQQLLSQLFGTFVGRSSVFYVVLSFRLFNKTFSRGDHELSFYHFVAGQQFKNPMGQGSGLGGMYPGLGGQGMQGGFGNNMGGYGGFGGGMPNNGGMDMAAATQRAMLEAAQNGGGMVSQQQQQQQQMMQQHQGGNQFNPVGLGPGMNFQGNMMGNMGGGMTSNPGGPPMGSDWMTQPPQQQLQQPPPPYNNNNNTNNHRPSTDSIKKEDDDAVQQYR
jgi:hypothetical protein